MKRFPHTYVIVFAIIVVVAILTWIIPGGEFARKTMLVNGHERVVIDASSFKYTTNQPQIWEILGAFFQGFVNQAGIIVFILIIGGAFWIINTTKSIDIGIQSLVRRINNANKIAFIRFLGSDNVALVFIMLIFSLFGAIFGMSEETIAFIVIFVPLAISMGYDSIIGISITYLAAHVGFAAAMMNPFTIGIAQGISQLPLFWYRISSFVLDYNKHPRYSLRSFVCKAHKKSSGTVADVQARPPVAKRTHAINFTGAI